MHRLEQDLARGRGDLGAGEDCSGIGVDQFLAVGGGVGVHVDLDLGIELVVGRHVPAVVGLDLAAGVDDGGHAGVLEAQEIHLDDEPLEEGEHLGEGVFARSVGQLGLVDGAVAESEVDVLLGNALLAGVAEAVLIRVVEDRSFEGSEPAIFQDVAQIDVFARGDGDRVDAEETIQRGVPGYELVGARRDVGE